jgi:hypothetical protein
MFFQISTEIVVSLDGDQFRVFGHILQKRRRENPGSGAIFNDEIAFGKINFAAYLADTEP